MQSAERISNIRIGTFGLTGLICLIYVGSILATGGTDWLPFWLPGLAGLLSAAILVLSSVLAGQKGAEMAWDEGYSADSRRAASLGYWIALALFPLFGVLMALDLVGAGPAYAMSGLLTGASYLLLMVWFELRGRA